MKIRDVAGKIVKLSVIVETNNGIPVKVFINNESLIKQPLTTKRTKSTKKN